MNKYRVIDSIDIDYTGDLVDYFITECKNYDVRQEVMIKMINDIIDLYLEDQSFYVSFQKESQYVYEGCPEYYYDVDMDLNDRNELNVHYFVNGDTEKIEKINIKTMNSRVLETLQAYYEVNYEYLETDQKQDIKEQIEYMKEMSRYGV